MNTTLPRVLLVSAEWAPIPGGLGDYTARLAEALIQAGVAVAVLTGRLPGARPATPAALGSTTPYPVMRRVTSWDWGMWPVIEAVAREWWADVVHLQYQTGAYRMHPAVNLAPYWLRRLGSSSAIVTTFHDLREPYLFRGAGPLRGAVNRALARGSHLAIATNPADYAQLAQQTRHLRLIPIGANIEPDDDTDSLAARLRSELGLASSESLLVTFGLLNHSKGLPTLLRALALLNSEAAVGRYRLVLVGGGDAGLDPTDQATALAAHRLAEELGIARALVWIGHQPAPIVAGWLRAADAVALPYVDGASYRRGTLLAALACGAAVVTTNPAAEMLVSPTASPGQEPPPTLPRLQSGVHVTLVAPEQPEALATALAATAGDPWLNRTLRSGAREVASHFGWPAIAAQTLTAYQAVRGRR